MNTPSPNYKWVLVGLLACVGALNYCDRAAIASVFPLIRADLRMSNVELAATGSLYLWAYALASPLGGVLADRVARGRVIVWSLAGWSLITLLTGFAASAHQLLLTRVLLGFVEAAYLPAAVALIADYHSSQTRATAIGFHTAGLTFGLVAGGTIAGYLGKEVGWHYAFFFLGFAGFGLAGVAHFVLRPLRAEPIPPQVKTPISAIGAVGTLIRIPSYLILVFVCMCSAVANNIFIIWLPLYFNETYQMGLARAGFAGTFALQSASMIALLGGGVLSDRLARQRPSRRMFFAIIFGFIAAPFLWVFFSPRPGLAVLYVCIFMFSFFHRLGDSNIVPLMCDLLPTRLRSTAFGILNAANCMTGGLAVMVAGLLKNRLGLAGVFGGISTVSLLSVGMLVVGYALFLKRDLARVSGLASGSASGP